MRVLVPVDGSRRALAALRFVIDRLAPESPGLEVHLLNVQPPLPAAVASFVADDVVKGYHKEEGDKALAEGRALLAASGLRHEAHVAVGEPPRAIADYAAEKACDFIAMSPRGHGVVADVLLGSTARKVLHLSRVPVMIVRGHVRLET
ncbi:MAG: universal stress protein [Rhodospirillaceae bacterium]|nr:universal stress protein [Rhodospirillaceae bacterium]